MGTTKADITDAVYNTFDCSKKEALVLVQETLDIISASLARGEDVKLSGFGNFNLRKKASRPGRNPRTGEKVSISARTVLTFKASAILRDLTNGRK
ncbi:MAG: integration host factor subunit alpha [Magnetococcales bacterium]|nr:integration host factor subunit alpha [Magnetococcales bacterium]